MILGRDVDRNCSWVCYLDCCRLLVALSRILPMIEARRSSSCASRSSCYNKGRHQKKKLVFFGKTPKGGGLAESKISLSEKTEIFLEFFFQKGGGSHLFQKGVIIKTGDFWIFSPKGEVSHNT